MSSETNKGLAERFADEERVHQLIADKDLQSLSDYRDHLSMMRWSLSGEARTVVERNLTIAGEVIVNRALLTEQFVYYGVISEVTAMRRWIETDPRVE